MDTVITAVSMPAVTFERRVYRVYLEQSGFTRPVGSDEGDARV